MAQARRQALTCSLSSLPAKLFSVLKLLRNHSELLIASFQLCYWEEMLEEQNMYLGVIVI